MWLNHTFTRFYYWNDGVSYNCLLVTYWAIAFRAVTYMSLKRNDAPLRFWFHFTCQICLAIGDVLYLLRYLKILKPRFFSPFFKKVRILIHTLRFLIVFARPHENAMLTENATISYTHLLTSNIVTKMDTCGWGVK